MNELTFLQQKLATAIPLIELRNVDKTFVTEGGVRVEALRSVSLSIDPGEFVAIMGASGSGKSTLMNILGCLDRPTSGSYRFSGSDVSALDADALAWLRREAFGFIFQSYNLLASATAEENVEIPAIYAGLSQSERKRRAEALLESLGLGDRLTHKPNQLSGGQQQRVSIARALMNGGGIILADEPTGALDSKSGTEVMALLQDLSGRGHTVILITHDPKVAEHARRVIELKDGEVVSDSEKQDKQAANAHSQIDWQNMQESRGRSPLVSGFDEALRMALRALRGNLFRTLLTLLGIVIGVSSVVAMLAIGEGAKRDVVERIGSMGTNLLVVRPSFRTTHGYSGPVTTLTREDAEAIARLPNVAAVLPELSGNATVRAGNADVQTEIEATTAELPATRSWPVERGVFFTENDDQSYAAVAILGQTVAATLFPRAQDPLGQYILVNNIPFQVIGTMSPKGATGRGDDADDVVFVPLSTGQLRVFGERYVRSITVLVSDLSGMSETQSALETLLRERHGDNDEFYVRNMEELVDTVSATYDTMTGLLAAVAAISLLVGGIGIMNIMLVNVTERTREIGIRTATGARRRDILQQFLSEAVLVSGIGGVAGVLCGIGAGFALRAFGTPVTFTAAPMILAFVCATATGLIFGYAPARKAAHMDPVVALANE